MAVKVEKLSVGSIIKCGKMVVLEHGLRLEIVPKVSPVFPGISVTSRVTQVEKMFAAICVAGSFMDKSLPVHIMKTVEVLRELPTSALMILVDKYVKKTIAIEEGCPKYIR